MIKLTEAEIGEVMERTGAPRETVEKVAMWIPGQYIRWGIVKGWSCARCITCLGLARKVFWCIICVTTERPTLGTKSNVLVKSTVQPFKTKVRKFTLINGLTRSRMGINIPEPPMITPYKSHVMSTKEIAGLPEDRMLTAPLTK